MNIIIFIGAVLLQTTYGTGQSEGVGSYSYQDSSGRRYGGVYGLKDGKVVNPQGDFPPNFQPPHEDTNFQDLDFTGDFFPEYFKNLENILEDAGFYYPPTPYFPSTPFMPRRLRPPFAMPFRHSLFGIDPFGIPNFPSFSRRAFKNNIESRKMAFDAARKAFDITSNRAHYNNQRYTPYNDYDVPNVPRYPGIPPPSFPDFSGYEGNSAFASGVIGPDFKEQIAAINPENPSNPNIKVTQLSDPSITGYKSVSVSSSSSSSDFNGRKSNTRQASTIINDNGQITRYDVRN